MSGARISQSTCPILKVQYATRQAADVALAAHRKRKSRRAPRLRAYECPLCGMWHLTKRQTALAPPKPRGVW